MDPRTSLHSILSARSAYTVISGLVSDCSSVVSDDTLNVLTTTAGLVHHQVAWRSVDDVDCANTCENMQCWLLSCWYDGARPWRLSVTRSARRHYLVVPRHSLSSYGRRTFAVADPTAWNSLSDDLRYPMLITDSFRRLLKTRLLVEY